MFEFPFSIQCVIVIYLSNIINLPTDLNFIMDIADDDIYEFCMCPWLKKKKTLYNAVTIFERKNMLFASIAFPYSVTIRVF